MPRIPNIRPTNIYWLYDIRPETLVEWPKGQPFYCGKTVSNVEVRLREHQRDAKNKHPNRAISKRLARCDGFTRIQIMEVVPSDGDWRECERHWIRSLRERFSGCVNLSDGGEGTPGTIHTVESRAKMSAARKGRKHSAEHCARIGAANRHRIQSAETRAKISAARMGRPTTTGKILSAETRAKIGAVQKGRKHTAEHRAKMTATRRENIRGSRSN